MKKILLVATGSVAVEKFKKVHDLLKKDFTIRVIATKYVRENYSDWKGIKVEEEISDLGTFPLHIEHASWADLILVVPATANTISKFNAGIADNQVLSTLIAARQPIIFVPAMNTYMYEALNERGIINNLKKFGHMFIGPTTGMLREGTIGMGRMIEPEEIFSIIKNYFNNQGKKILISYGASKIYIDPIRFITNDSTGQTAKLLENELRLLGHSVEMIDVSKYSNQELIDEIKKKDFEIYISPAAIADYDVKNPSKTKIKKNTISEIKIENNLDVIEEISKLKNKKIIAFKLDNDKNNALKKMKKLNLHGIIWNKLGSMGNSKVTGAIMINGNEKEFKNLEKSELVKLIGGYI
ncbi:MAG: hypothetical protein HRT99_03555 [Mycoplasmatales bacterium]|nr:hypothetical protein [Mycoplasmatales bacterium]